VITRHDDPRRLDRFQKCPRLFELRALRALGQIARDGHEIRPDPVDKGDQRSEDRLIDLPEMQIGEMDDGAHATTTITLGCGRK
jgi:hypothetical protein